MKEPVRALWWSALLVQMEIENNTLGIEIQNSFFNLLKEHFPKSLLQKAKEGNVIKIISIACGRFREAKSIFDYFSSFEKALELYGIEIDKEFLTFAENELKNKKQVYLKAADASLMESYKDWGEFDLIIVRHPEITFNTDIFIKIFANCKNILKKDGYLLITTHFENEKEAIIPLLKLLNFKLVSSVENKNAPIAKTVKSDSEVSYADKFLLIATGG